MTMAAGNCPALPDNHQEEIMKFHDLLAKLGILRYGVKAGTYTSAKDRPVEFMMDDVVNSERDLTTREDLKSVAKAVKKKLA